MYPLNCQVVNHQLYRQLSELVNHQLYRHLSQLVRPLHLLLPLWEVIVLNMLIACQVHVSKRMEDANVKFVMTLPDATMAVDRFISAN